MTAREFAEYKAHYILQNEAMTREDLKNKALSGVASKKAHKKNSKKGVKKRR